MLPVDDLVGVLDEVWPEEVMSFVVFLVWLMNIVAVGVDDWIGRFGVLGSLLPRDRSL